jgi:uncharacterized Zn finger protein
MDARKERGRELAQRGRIVKLTQGWRVSSQSGSGSYFVRLAKALSCTCPDFEYWQLPCKHIYPALFMRAKRVHGIHSMRSYNRTIHNHHLRSEPT